MTNNFANFLDGEYPYRYLAKSTNQKITLFNCLARRGSPQSDWVGNSWGSPIAPLAPPSVEVSYAEGTRI